MKLALVPLSIVLALQVQRVPAGPFVPVGIWYAGPAALPPAAALSDADAIAADLAVVRRAGFNAITTWIAWRDAEPERGKYALTGIERLVAAAGKADLRVLLVVYLDRAPAWASGDPAAPASFLEYLSRRMSLQPAVAGVTGRTTVDRPMPGRIEVRPDGAPVARLAMWSELARGARGVSFVGTGDPLSPEVLSLGETAGVVTRNQALFAPLRPREGGVVRLEGGEDAGKVEIRLLESNDALLIVGLNHAPEPRKVSITFSPEIPEAIWQNLETGTAVSFVMGKSGPVLEHTFASRDALVLMIRKQLR